MSYDNWKMTEPYDPDADVPTCCACDAPCDGTLHYLNRPRTEVYCPECFILNTRLMQLGPGAPDDSNTDN